MLPICSTVFFSLVGLSQIDGKHLYAATRLQKSKYKIEWHKRGTKLVDKGIIKKYMIGPQSKRLIKGEVELGMGLVREEQVRLGLEMGKGRT